MQSVKRHIWALVAVLACASGASAQESRGTITGRVVDSSGGALPGATVTAVNDDTNSTQTVPTSGSGTYSVLYLVPGPYTVTVEQSGFRTTRQKVIVRVADRVVVDFTLDPAANSEEIFVVAETPLLETGSATTGQIMDSKIINEIRELIVNHSLAAVTLWLRHKEESHHNHPIFPSPSPPPLSLTFHTTILRLFPISLLALLLSVLCLPHRCSVSFL